MSAGPLDPRRTAFGPFTRVRRGLCWRRLAAVAAVLWLGMVLAAVATVPRPIPDSAECPTPSAKATSDDLVDGDRSPAG